MTSSRRPPNPLHTLSRLRAEWELLATNAAALSAARSWHLPIPSFDSLDDVLVAAGMRLRVPDGAGGQGGDQSADCGDHRLGNQPAGPPEDGMAGGVAGGVANDRCSPAGDDVLRALVGAARIDELAARIVLQRLLPGLSATARRHGRCHSEHLVAFDELAAVAWEVIRAFPVERRPHYLAAALLRDCEHQAFRKHTRRLLVQEPTEPHRLDRIDNDAPQEPLLELCQVIRTASTDHLTQDDLDLLRLLMSGSGLVEVAKELSVSVRTVRNHRASTIHRLRAAVATDAA